MKTRNLLVLALLLTFLISPAIALAAEPTAPGKVQTVCPVMGGNIDKNLFIDYQGQRVYFCCPACLEVFKKDPEKFLQKMKDQGVTPEKSPEGKK
jgi:YHS domain-containing protein